MSIARACLGAALALCLAAGSGWAQSAEAADAQKGHGLSTDDRWLLDGRDREMLHAGMPVELIGIDEGDATFRTRTPLLANSDQAVVMVDAEENYARRIAMYETRERFHTPPPRAAGASATTFSRGTRGHAAESRSTEGSSPAQEEEHSGGTRNLISLLLSAVLIALIALRRK